MRSLLCKPSVQFLLNLEAPTVISQQGKQKKENIFFNIWVLRSDQTFVIRDNQPIIIENVREEFSNAR